jgi:hypothetical protein
MKTGNKTLVVDVYCDVMLFCNVVHLRVTLFWVDEIQNGDTHGHMKVIESTPSCRKFLSSMVWNGFSLVFQLNMYIGVTFRKSFALTAPYNMFYGITMLEGEAKRVCLLDMPLDAGNIMKEVDMRSDYCDVTLEH